MLYARLFERSDAPIKIRLGEIMDGWEWEDELRYLDDTIGILDTHWHVKAENIGWRNRSGEKMVYAEDVMDWVRQVCGFDCSCHVHILADPDNKNEMEAYIYHHDSPTGEYRKLTRMKEWSVQLYDGDQLLDETSVDAISKEEAEEHAWYLFKEEFGWTNLSDQAYLSTEEM